MAHVDGLGGLFLFANDAATLAAWYTELLGIEFVRNEECDNYYVEFAQRDSQDPNRPANTVFAIFGTSMPLPRERRECRINFRVNDLAELLAHVQSKGVEINKYEEYDYGLFAWISDPEGYSLELYQPIA